MSTVPSLEASGQPALATEADSKAALEQTPRPLAAEGLAVTPSGRVATIFLMSALARPSGEVSPSSSTWIEKSRPLGDSAAELVARVAICGAKGSASQPVIPCGLGGVASSWVKTVSAAGGWPSQEVAKRVVASGPVQARGRVRKVFSGMSTGQSPLETGSVLGEVCLSTQDPRRALWAGSEGLPHRVTEER